MRKSLISGFNLSVVIFFCNAFFPYLVHAEDAYVKWGGQLYGGKYYKDNLLGVYGLASAPAPFGEDLTIYDLTISAEVLDERYQNHGYAYNLSGVGAHISWVVSEYTKFGLVGSHSREKYSFSTNGESIKTNYLSKTLGIEGEFGNDHLTLAIQAGGVHDDNYSNQHRYVSTNFFYWGDLHRWYIRSGVKRVKNYNEYSLEASYSFFSERFPANLYLGTTRDNVFANNDNLSAPGQYNSVYTGCNIEFLTTASTVWSLWGEAARQASETILSVELNISFGPNSKSLYSSAFDYIR